MRPKDKGKLKFQGQFRVKKLKFRHDNISVTLYIMGKNRFSLRIKSNAVTKAICKSSKDSLQLLVDKSALVSKIAEFLQDLQQMLK